MFSVGTVNSGIPLKKRLGIIVFSKKLKMELLYIYATLWTWEEFLSLTLIEAKKISLLIKSSYLETFSALNEDHLIILNYQTLRFCTFIIFAVLIYVLFNISDYLSKEIDVH